MNNRFDGVNTRLDAVNTRLDAVNTRLDAIEEIQRQHHIMRARVRTALMVYC